MPDLFLAGVLTMPVTAQCPGCGTTYANIKDELVGKSVKCKKCQQNFIIAGGSRAVKPAPAAPSAARPAPKPAPPAPKPAARPKPPPVEEEEAVAVEATEDDVGRPARGPGGVKHVPKSNLVLCLICCGAIFLLCGGPWLLITAVTYRSVSTIKIQGGKDFNPFKDNPFKDNPFKDVKFPQSVSPAADHGLRRQSMNHRAPLVAPRVALMSPAGPPVTRWRSLILRRVARRDTA
jgi:hypothetical protein